MQVYYVIIVLTTIFHTNLLCLTSWFKRPKKNQISRLHFKAKMCECSFIHVFPLNKPTVKWVACCKVHVLGLNPWRNNNIPLQKQLWISAVDKPGLQKVMHLLTNSNFHKIGLNYFQVTSGTNYIGLYYHQILLLHRLHNVKFVFLVAISRL